MTFRPTCPICGGRSFKAHGTRTLAQCCWCGALERTRLLRLCIDHLPPFLPRRPFLHFNPEPALLPRLQHKLGALYRPCSTGDKAHTGHKPLPHVDIASVRSRFGAGALSGVVHVHVLMLDSDELTRIIADLNGALAPGGVHLFSIAVTGPGAAERLAALLTEPFAGFDALPLAELIDRLDLEEAGVPGDALTSRSSGTVFGFQKRRFMGPALKLLSKIRRPSRYETEEDD